MNSKTIINRAANAAAEYDSDRIGRLSFHVVALEAEVQSLCKELAQFKPVEKGTETTFSHAGCDLAVFYGFVDEGDFDVLGVYANGMNVHAVISEEVMDYIREHITDHAYVMRTAATRGQQDAARNELHAAIANATGVAKMTDTITLPRAVIERTLKCLNTPETQDLRLVSSVLYAALAQQAEQAPTGFEKYLKEGETPLQRLEREIKDGSALMKIYGKALTQIQELQAQRWTTPIAFYEIANNEYGEIEYEFSVYPRPGFKPLFAQAIPAAPKGGV